MKILFKIKFFIHENASQKIVCEMVAFPSGLTQLISALSWAAGRRKTTQETSPVAYFSADSRFAANQWETALLCNDVSHWLGANLESALLFYQGNPSFAEVAKLPLKFSGGLVKLGYYLNK